MKGIITLCGSTKFKKEFEEANRILTIGDWIVLSVGSFHHSEDVLVLRQEIIDHKKELDRLHKEKISISQAILVIDAVNKYIGESTKSEIEHATRLGKIIYYWSKGDHIKLTVGTIPKTG